MTGERANTQRQREMSEARKRQAARSKHHTQKASNKGVNAFFKNIGKSAADREYEMLIVVSAKGGGRFEVKDVHGHKREQKVTLKRGLFLPGKLHHRGEMGAAIGAGSHVVVKDDEIVGVMGRHDVLVARQRLGLSESAERVAPEGFAYVAPKRRTRSLEKKRSGSRSRSRSRSRGKNENNANNGKNLNLYKGKAKDNNDD